MRRVILVVPLAFLLALAGCGSSNGASSGSVTDQSAATVTKKDFIKRGNEICAHYETTKERKLEAAFKSGESLTQARGEELVTAIVIPLVAKLSREMGDIGLPAKEGVKAAAVVVALQRGLKRAEHEPASAVDGTAFKKADEVAAAYGMTSCVL